MAEKTTRTIYGMLLQTCQRLRLPFTLATNSTLNELLGVLADQQQLDANVYPTLGYLAVGNGGLSATVSADGTLAMVPKIYESTSAAAYNPLPLVLRPLNNDLDAVTRAKYALRRIESHGGVQYIAYYLKRLDLSTVTAGMFLTTVVNDVKTTVPFVPDTSVLHPTAPDTSTSTVITADGTYVSASAPLEIVLDDTDVGELTNVFMIIYNNPNTAILSELLLCSGVDKNVAVSDNGGTSFNMKEAIAVQVNDFINVGAPLQFNSEGVKFSMDIGATEPLWATS